MSLITLRVNGRQPHASTSIRRRRCSTSSATTSRCAGRSSAAGSASAAPARSSSNGQAIRSCVTPVQHGRRRRDHDARRARHRRAAASDSAGVHRRAGGAVRLLPERRHPDGQGVPRPESDARPTPRSGRRCPACCAAASRTRGCCAAIRRYARREDGMSADLTPDARAALDAGRLLAPRLPEGLRRARSSAFSVGDGSTGTVVGAAAAQGINGAAAHQLDAWIAIAADGTVTAYTGKCELGQGLYTAQMQLVAEELCVPFDRVRLIQCDTSLTPDQGTTSGQPVASGQLQPARTWRWPRDRARGAGAARVDAARRPGRAARRGDGVGRRASRCRRSGSATASWSAAGRSTSPLDPDGEAQAPERVDGARHAGAARRHAGDGHRASSSSSTTCACPACCTAASCGRRPSAPRSSASTSARSRDMPGVVKVVVKKNFVGVVAEKPWQAMQAAAQLKVTWTPGTGLPPQRDVLRPPAARSRRATRSLVDSGDVDAALARRRRPSSRRPICIPYQMHGSIGSSCAVADVQGEQGDDLVGHAGRLSDCGTRAAMLLGLPARQRARRSSRAAPAATASTAPTRCPTTPRCCRRRSAGRCACSCRARTRWPGRTTGCAFVIDQRAALDADGTIVAWDYEAWSPALGGRPGYDTPGNVVTGIAGRVRAGARSRRGRRRRRPPRRSTTAATPRRRTSPAASAASARGAGVVASERVLSHRVASPFFTGPLRSPERLQNTFAHECFMDEVAARVEGRSGRVPAAAPERPAAAATSSRRRRRRRTGRRARRRGRTSPRPASRSGRGIACVLYEGDNGYVRDGRRGRRRSGHRRGHGQAARRRAGLRADLESRRHAQPDRRRRAAGHEPRAASKK